MSGRGRIRSLNLAALEVHEIGEDYILGRWTSELYVESVRRYHLQRVGS